MSFFSKVKGSASSLTEKLTESATSAQDKFSASASSLTEKISEHASLPTTLSDGFQASEFGKTVRGYASLPDSLSGIVENPQETLHAAVSGIGDALYVVHFILGCGILLPWNAYLIAVDYFDYVYPDSHIDRVFSVSYLVPSLTALALLILFGQKLSSHGRINGGLVLFFLGILSIPIIESAFIRGGLGSTWTYSVTIAFVVLAGLGDALVQGTLIATAGLLPPRYLQAIVSGTGFSGVLIALLRIITKWSFAAGSEGVRKSAIVYFSVGAVILVICAVLYNVVYKLTEKMAMFDEFQNATAAGLAHGLAERASESLDLEDRASDLFHDLKKKATETTFLGQHIPASAIAMGASSAEEAFEKGKDFMLDQPSVKDIFIELKWLAAAITLTYIISLSIFPGFLTEDVSSTHFGDWYPVLLLACYNFFDFVGKCLPADYVPSTPTWVIISSIARVLFIPVFALCTYGPSVFRVDVFVFFLTGFLGITNGFLTTCFFVLAPKCVKKAAEAEVAGFIMVMSLQVGLTVGSLVAWFWVI